MDIKLVNRGQVGELLLSGRINSTNAAEVGEIFMQVSDRFNTIVLNMQELTYISSAGLRDIMQLYQKLRSQGGELSAINVSPYITELFEMTGFTGVLRMDK